MALRPTRLNGSKTRSPGTDYPLVDTAVPAQSVLDTAKAAGGKHLKDVSLFDVYIGKQVLEGKKSLALNLVFQSHERTLTDKDTQKAWDNILKSLEQKCGATLRG